MENPCPVKDSRPENRSKKPGQPRPPACRLRWEIRGPFFSPLHLSRKTSQGLDSGSGTNWPAARSWQCFFNTRGTTSQNNK